MEIDEDLLKQIASETGGKYFRATNNTKLMEIYNEINQMEKTRTTIDSFPVYSELFMRFALIALACLLALDEGVIPPTINLKEQDEACDLNCTPNRAVKAGITLALSNSLGFGGHNACLAFRKV